MGSFFSDETLGEEIGQRLRDVRGNDSRAKVQELTGLHPNTLANYEKGRLPDVRFVNRFCKVYGISERWLLTGVGDRKTADNHADGQVPIPVYKLPALSGRSTSMIHRHPETVMHLPQFFLDETGIARSKIHAIYNYGALNQPDIGDGDILIVQMSASLSDDGYYLIQAGGVLLCRIIERKIDGGVCIRLRTDSLGQNMSEEKTRDLNIFGRVIWRIGVV